MRGHAVGPGADRGQLVLLAAAALAMALVPLTLAHLQLGYHDDVGATQVADSPLRDAERSLDRSLASAVDGIPAGYPWADRGAAVTTVRDRLRPDIATINTSAIDRGTALAVRYNRSAASIWASANCPSGPDRQFGPCEADRGLVVQERAGQTHVLAATFDVVVTAENADVRATTVLRVAR